MATLKRQVQRLAKELRRDGMDFMTAQVVARSVVRGGFATELEQKLKVHNVQTYVYTACPCCGPEEFQVFQNGKVFRFHYFHLGYKGADRDTVSHLYFK